MRKHATTAAAAPEACPHCDAPLHGFAGAVCPWCSRRMDDAETRPGVLARRLAILAITGVALLGWFFFVPWRSWTTQTVAIFGSIAAVLLFVTWVVSGELIER